MILDEIKKFILFFLSLTIIVALLTSLRTQNLIYLYADSGIEIDENQLSKNVDFVKNFTKTFISLLNFDFGVTLSGNKVGDHILQRLEPTFVLAFFSILSFGSMSILFSLISVYKRTQFFGEFISFISNFILSTPIFIVSVILFIVFFLELSLLPPGGYERWELSYLIMPSFALGSRTFARVYLIGYSQAKIEIKSPFIFLLKARGFSDKIIVFKYVLMKIFPMILVYLLLDFSSLLSGAMIVEEIFFFPGIGKSTYSAIKNMDSNLLKGLLVYSGIVFYILTRVAKIIQNTLINQQSNND
jgi:peptide/nickel transport system permease protein